jgi:hypothetical protein
MASRDHEQCVQDIGAGDGARHVRRVAAGLDQREQRHDEQAAERTQQQQVGQDAQRAGLVQHAGGIDRQCVHVMHAGEIQVDAEQRQANRPKRHQSDLDFVSRQFLAQQRAGADAQRKRRQQQHDHAVVAMQVIPGVQRKLRQHQRAVEPEPRIAEHRQEHRAVLTRKRQIAHRLGDEVAADGEMRGRRRRIGDAQAGRQAEHGDGQCAESHHVQAGLAMTGQQRAEHFAEQDADESAHFDYAIAADQFFRLQVLRQVSVFDRAEHGRVHAHADHGGDQEPERVAQPAGRGHAHDRDLEQLDPARQAALLDLVGNLAGGCREHDIRQDEQARNDLVQQRGRDLGPGPGIEGDRNQQRILEQVVVESAQELGPEKRTETALGQQRKLARSLRLAHGKIVCWLQ